VGLAGAVRAGRVIRAAAALALPILLGLPAAAAAGGSLASACALDFELFCGDVDRESPRAEVVACLEATRGALTESCRAALDPGSVPRAPTGPGPVAEACGADFRRWCGDATHRIALARCVRTHSDRLSEACREALELDPSAPADAP